MSDEENPHEDYGEEQPDMTPEEPDYEEAVGPAEIQYDIEPSHDSEMHEPIDHTV